MEDRKLNGIRESIIQTIECMNKVMAELYSVEYVEPFIRKIAWKSPFDPYVDLKRSILISYIDTRSIDYDGMSYLMYLTRDKEIQTWMENKLSQCDNPFTSDAEYLSRILSACDDNWADKEMYPHLMAEECFLKLKKSSGSIFFSENINSEEQDNGSGTLFIPGDYWDAIGDLLDFALLPNNQYLHGNIKLSEGEYLKFYSFAKLEKKDFNLAIKLIRDYIKQQENPNKRQKIAQDVWKELVEPYIIQDDRYDLG